MPKCDLNEAACKFSEHLFIRTPLEDCFCLHNMYFTSRNIKEENKILKKIKSFVIYHVKC